MEDFTRDDIDKMGIQEAYTSYDETIKKVLSANKSTKTITVIEIVDSEMIEEKIQLDTFWVKNKATDEVVYGW